MNSIQIAFPHAAAPLLQLAARELRRYLYLRTGTWSDLVEPTSSRNTDQHLALELDSAALQPQCYRIESLAGQTIRIVGGDEQGALFGCYAFLKELGIHFALHGDSVPDASQPLKWPTDLLVEGQPQFGLRGIVPFHDFAEGPDWWSADDYKAYLAQLPKLGMNFFGLHTYPESAPESRQYKAEPTVWIGLPEDQRGGQVTSAYPAMLYHTPESTWGSEPAPTSAYDFGAAQLFEHDDFGPDFMQNRLPWPHTPAENVEIFNAMGTLLGDAFSLARRLEIKTCLGTETPLTVPQQLQQHLHDKNLDTHDPATTVKLYEGLFRRIKETHPLDYYWLWTPESWTWQGEAQADVKRVEDDIQHALTGLNQANSTVQLALSGWVLGPSSDRAAFDRNLPKSVPLSCINREQGNTPVDPGFANIHDRPKWVISWLEDDPAMVSPQLWVGRVRKDALDAHDYGCTGLMGIHWRTRVLDPTLLSLAEAGWTLPDGQEPLHGGRDLANLDLYLRWAAAEFGEEVAQPVAAVFSRLDGGPEYLRPAVHEAVNRRAANLYRTSEWYRDAPGVVVREERPWAEIAPQFDFIGELERLASWIGSAAQQERFAYWLNTFRYTRELARVGCLLGELDRLAADLSGPGQLEQALDLRAEAAEGWGKAITFLLMTVQTPGELGCVAGLHHRSLGTYQALTLHDAALSAALTEPLPALPFWSDYRGEARLIIPTLRRQLEEGEDLRLRVLLLGQPLAAPHLHWRPLGSAGDFTVEAFEHLGRGVYTCRLLAEVINGQDFEYSVSAQMEQGTLQSPPDPAAQRHSVVIW